MLELDWLPLRTDKTEPLVLCIAGADSSFRLIAVNMYVKIFSYFLYLASLFHPSIFFSLFLSLILLLDCILESYFIECGRRLCLLP